MADRSLTVGERQMVISMFGPSIDVDAIRITTNVAWFGQNVPAVPTGETVYWPSGLPGRPYYPDFSDPSLSLQLRGDFMHELTHVWQNQHGKETNSLFGDHMTEGQWLYSLAGVTGNTKWDDLNLNLEQQAEIVKNVYIQMNGGSLPPGALTLQNHFDILRSSVWFGQDPTHPPQSPSGALEHSARAPVLVMDADEFENQFGHPFDGTLTDNHNLADLIARGNGLFSVTYVDASNYDPYANPLFATNGDQIVVSLKSTSWFASMVRNGEIQQIIQNNNDGSHIKSQFDISGVLQSQEEVFAAGNQLLKYYDTHNTHPYSEVDITRDILGHITGTQVTMDVNVAAVGGSISQVFGSAIGRALAPSNQFAQLAAGTVAGAIGQKLALAFSSSLSTDATKVVVGDIFNNFGISLASAGAGSVASFLTAELGTALGITVTVH